MRERLKEVLSEIVKQYKQKSYEELINLPNNFVIHKKIKGRMYQIEVDVLERRKDYVHLIFAIDDMADKNIWHFIFPVSKGLIVKNNQ